MCCYHFLKKHCLQIVQGRTHKKTFNGKFNKYRNFISEVIFRPIYTIFFLFSVEFPTVSQKCGKSDINAVDIFITWDVYDHIIKWDSKMPQNTLNFAIFLILGLFWLRKKYFKVHCTKKNDLQPLGLQH